MDTQNKTAEIANKIEDECSMCFIDKSDTELMEKKIAILEKRIEVLEKLKAKSEVEPKIKPKDKPKVSEFLSSCKTANNLNELAVSKKREKLEQQRNRLTRKIEPIVKYLLSICEKVANDGKMHIRFAYDRRTDDLLYRCDDGESSTRIRINTIDNGEFLPMIFKYENPNNYEDDALMPFMIFDEMFLALDYVVSWDHRNCNDYDEVVVSWKMAGGDTVENVKKT